MLKVRRHSRLTQGIVVLVAAIAAVAVLPQVQTQPGSGPGNGQTTTDCQADPAGEPVDIVVAGQYTGRYTGMRVSYWIGGRVTEDPAETTMANPYSKRNALYWELPTSEPVWPCETVRVKVIPMGGESGELECWIKEFVGKTPVTRQYIPDPHEAKCEWTAPAA
ncbi:MAG TPA: hypothetical protein VMT30_06040 [Candidatus Saccharimonadia bacterium]|nr:hypothetical protein [Candidatus Saccharimonadia bacterium]